jgi:L-iditol 2-dehydrogenase
MKAAVVYAPGDIRVEEVDDPKPRDGYALVRVQACGVCPSDIRRFYGSAGFDPWIPGHEVSGVLVDLGGDYSGPLAAGDRVVADWRVVCGRCSYCLAGHANFCEQREEFPIAGFAEYTVVPHRALHPLPATISFAEASFCEPLACVLNAHRSLPARPAADVAVLGAGPIGLLHAQVALHRGARVIAVDPLEQRRSLARELGVHDVVDPAAGDPVDQVRELTGGYGAGVVIVAVGSMTAAEQAIAMARKGGFVNLFAGIYPPSELRIDPNVLHYGEISLTGSHDYAPAEFAQALRLLEYRMVRAAPLITHHYPLPEIADAFATARDQRGLKSIVHPGEAGEGAGEPGRQRRAEAGQDEYP